jgi:hypothetical protein
MPVARRLPDEQWRRSRIAVFESPLTTPRADAQSGDGLAGVEDRDSPRAATRIDGSVAMPEQ